MANIDCFPVNIRQGKEGEAIYKRWLNKRQADIAPYSRYEDTNFHVDADAQ